MKTLVIDRPNPKQALFLADHHKYIGFGGARGGGKSWAVRTKAILLAARYAGIRILIVRRTYPELINNHISILRAQLAGVARYNDHYKRLTLDNGSTIHFAYCAKDADLDRLQGVEYDIIFLDEATQLSEHQMRSITACLRGVNSFPKRVYFTCNPGGQGHAYIKRIFIDKKYEENESAEDYSFVQSLVTDNDVLLRQQPEYLDQLKALPPKLRRAWLDGDWNIFEGAFFDDFCDDPEHYMDGRWTHVIEPFAPPAEWRIYRSYDFGYNKPFSCGWWAVDGDGVVYRILELYGCTGQPNEGVKWEPEKQFAEIKSIEDTHPWLAGRKIYGIADPSIWDGSRGTSIAEVAEHKGILFEPGVNDRIAGWMQFHYRLKFDSGGKPMMYIFKNCEAFRRTIPLLQYDAHKAEDLDTDGEDHVADEARYFLMSRPIKAPSAAEPVEYRPFIDPIDTMQKMEVTYDT